MRNHNFSPERLARKMSGDPDILNESLFGYHVKRGPTQIDQFVNAIEHNYIDWDITDPKFEMLFFKIFQAPQGTDTRMMSQVLIKTLQNGRHSQDQALIDKLVKTTQAQWYKFVNQRNPTGTVYKNKTPKRGLVQLKNGAKFDCAVIIDGARDKLDLNPNLLWLGVANAPNPHPIVTGNNNHPRIRALPELYRLHSVVRKPNYRIRRGLKMGRMNASMYKTYYYSKPYKVVTVKKDNIANIIDYDESLEVDEG